MNGGPSQMDLWDYKPKLAELFDKDLPDIDPQGPAAHHHDQRPGALPRRAVDVQVRAARQVRRAGSASCCRTPRRSSTTCAIVKTVHTEAINHDPAITYICTGSQMPGRPSLGSWLSYGLGSENQNLPAFVVHDAVAGPAARTAQALFTRLWGRGFLPTQAPGRGAALAAATRCCTCPTRRASTPTTRRRMLDALGRAEPEAARRGRRPGDADPHRPVRDGLPHADARARADRPLARSRKHVLDLYGPDVHKPGTFAASCLLARRLAERGVRFVQIFHRGWDQHGNLPGDLPQPVPATSTRPATRLITDLKQRGLLDDTLVVWGGEFGRTVYCQGTLTKRQLRPRPPPALLHACGWPAAASSRASSTARPTTSATTSSRTRSTSTT